MNDDLLALEQIAEERRLEILRLNESIGELLGRIAALEKDKCEHCGGKVLSYSPTVCPGCGAPNCCESCCKIENLQARIAELEAAAEAIKIEPYEEPSYIRTGAQ